MEVRLSSWVNRKLIRALDAMLKLVAVARETDADLKFVLKSELSYKKHRDRFCGAPIRTSAAHAF
jgi:hypothetical protein